MDNLKSKEKAILELRTSLSTIYNLPGLGTCTFREKALLRYLLSQTFSSPWLIFVPTSFATAAYTSAGSTTGPQIISSHIQLVLETGTTLRQLVPKMYGKTLCIHPYGFEPHDNWLRNGVGVGRLALTSNFFWSSHTAGKSQRSTMQHYAALCSDCLPTLSLGSSKIEYTAEDAIGTKLGRKYNGQKNKVDMEAAGDTATQDTRIAALNAPNENEDSSPYFELKHTDSESLDAREWRMDERLPAGNCKRLRRVGGDLSNEGLRNRGDDEVGRRGWTGACQESRPRCRRPV
ncbi:hypothetical protein FB45DRAFT_1007923 [Roridomyces roridus]|uniref:Uncharacterized protein n=1 Tax=Roridomyces roridus TaxID=1738132 RepID=A0AAD7BD77_9AGAR|nr:hypothetical protein FB45DRAFT_1007923 [Roridomyces roridus]